MTRLLAAMLFEISATDVTTYVVACAVLAVAALLASIVPLVARSASIRSRLSAANEIR